MTMTMPKKGVLAVALAASGAWGAGTATSTTSPFRDGETVVFWGDSITQQAKWIRFVTDFYHTRYPDRKIAYRNAGIAGNSFGGGIREIPRDVAPWRPTTVVTMFGMNDSAAAGPYHPGWPSTEAERERLRARVERGYRVDADEARKALRAQCGEGLRIVMMTPSVYDSTARTPRDKPVNDGWNLTLGESGKKLVEGHAAGKWELIDLWGPMTAFNARMQKANPDFSVVSAQERVHPDDSGAWFMAQQVLEAQGVDPVVSEIRFDASRGVVRSAKRARVSDVRRTSGGWTLAVREEALPFPTPARAQEMARLSPWFAGRAEAGVNGERLVAEGLAKGTWELSVDGVRVWRGTDGELAAGVNLGENPATPQMAQARRVTEANRLRHEKESRLRALASIRWWLSLGSKVKDPDDVAEVGAWLAANPENGGLFGGGRFLKEYLAEWPRRAATYGEIDAMDAEIARLRQPATRVWRLVRAWDEPAADGPRPLALVPRPRHVVAPGGTTTNAAVVFRRDASIPAEGYRLTVTDAGAEIAFSDGAGRLYAQVTRDQLKGEGGAWTKAEIADAPAFPWRGWLLDVCRHWFPKEDVLAFLDVMTLHKMNVFHWHLTEDQAWRLPVDGYPELTEFGAARPYSPDLAEARWRKVRGWVGDAGTPAYGPYAYTRQDVAEILAYAKARHIRVVPEIDMPGHMRAFLAAYPDLGCCADALATNRVPRATWGVETDVLCLGNDRAVAVALDVLDKVCDMFPDSDVIHIGGDECPTTRWESCPKCLARMKAEGLEKPRDLQVWFCRKISERLTAKGRRMMGWAEIVQRPGLDPTAAIPMAWLYDDEGQRRLGNYSPTFAELVERGYDIVAGSHKHAYWGTPHDRAGDAYEPAVPPGRYYFGISLEDAYSLDLDVGALRPGKGRVLGTEAYSWGEGVWNWFDLMWKALPRTCAIAELAWSNPTPKDYPDFYARMQEHAKRLRLMRIPCAPLDPPGSRRE